MAVHEYDKILTRLISILTKLHNGETPTTKELAEEFNVTGRTILRDMDDRLTGFPIYKEKNRWKMQDGFKLEKVQSFEDELVLSILEKFADDIGGNFATKTHNLLEKLKNNDVNPIYTKLNLEDITDKFDSIKLLEDAIKNRNVIECIYDNEIDEPYEEILKPLKIVNYEGFWYLVGLDEDDYVRKLYLKKVSNINITTETFETNSTIDEMLKNSISIWFQSDRETFKVLLHADHSIAKYFKRKPLPTQKILATDTDGSIEFEISITYKMEIIPIIKYWMPHLRVLEPQWLLEEIYKDIKNFMDIGQ